MLKEVEMFLLLVFLLIGIVLVFNARFIVRKKMDVSRENLKVNILKWLGVIVIIASLGLIYCIR